MGWAEEEVKTESLKELIKERRQKTGVRRQNETNSRREAEDRKTPVE